jgi:quaternary ammonium compound-resistance protein SugE
MLEVVWASSLTATDGLTRVWPLTIAFCAILLSFALFAFSLKAVPFATAYAVWAGMGAAGTMIAGMALFGEPADAFRIGCLGLIIGGMLGLKLAS